MTPLLRFLLLLRLSAKEQTKRHSGARVRNNNKKSLSFSFFLTLGTPTEKRTGRPGLLPSARSRALGASAEVGIMPGSPMNARSKQSV